MKNFYQFATQVFSYCKSLNQWIVYGNNMPDDKKQQIYNVVNEIKHEFDLQYNTMKLWRSFKYDNPNGLTKSEIENTIVEISSSNPIQSWSKTSRGVMSFVHQLQKTTFDKNTRYIVVSANVSARNIMLEIKDGLNILNVLYKQLKKQKEELYQDLSDDELHMFTQTSYQYRSFSDSFAQFKEEDEIIINPRDTVMRASTVLVL